MRMSRRGRRRVVALAMASAASTDLPAAQFDRVLHDLLPAAGSFWNNALDSAWAVPNAVALGGTGQYRGA
jgi:hypothetical protein